MYICRITRDTESEIKKVYVNRLKKNLQFKKLSSSTTEILFINLDAFVSFAIMNSKLLFVIRRGFSL